MDKIARITPNVSRGGTQPSFFQGLSDPDVSTRVRQCCSTTAGDYVDGLYTISMVSPICSEAFCVCTCLPWHSHRPMCS